MTWNTGSESVGRRETTCLLCTILIKKCEGRYQTPVTKNINIKIEDKTRALKIQIFQDLIKQDHKIKMF